MGKHQNFPLSSFAAFKRLTLCVYNMFICVVTKKSITASESSNQSTDTSIWCYIATLLDLNHNCYNTSNLSFHGSLVYYLESPVLFNFEWLVVGWREVMMSPISHNHLSLCNALACPQLNSDSIEMDLKQFNEILELRFCFWWSFMPNQNWDLDSA